MSALAQPTSGEEHMIIILAGHTPQINSTAYVTPNAVVCSDGGVGAGYQLMFGA
jgi:carbonic anhydrase/acetyltransferase-like protein (isoleucine patch superfamily)